MNRPPSPSRAPRDATPSRHRGPAISQTDVRDGVRALGIGPGDTVMAHSSLSAFGCVTGGADAVIDGLLEAVAPSGTLVLPTFTWNAFHDAQRVEFDVLNTPCETGRIPETFRRRPGVVRSVHLCHSVAATGPRARQVLGDGVSPFGPGSPFAALLELQAWILLLGVSFQTCTALHAVEEFVGVPYRAHRNFAGSTVILADGRRVPSLAIEYLRQDGSRNDFAKTEAVFCEAGVLREGRIGAAECRAVRIADLFRLIRPLLERDAGYLST